ncbi:MAG: A/G-specific adenine glycosylase [Alphaproteobacteria bacterium]|nr:A/G-specific adenine glycosylase [Alphaproteobacteria bacterium]
MFSGKLLKWYAKAQRKLPWRTDVKNPYHTWLSEIMLQQTTVATVIPYFNAFIKRWPTVQDLCSASLDEVLTQWQGLGYYSRARNLHKCAQILAKGFPSTEEDLLKLPGIGPYTAAAISSIAFDEQAAAVDGNVVRVISRYFAIATLKPTLEIRERVKTLLPTEKNGDFTQALMEFGALLCRPKNPLCITCPLQSGCQAYMQGKTENYPMKAPKRKLPTRYATAFILRREDGAILLRKRPLQGLLGGMMEVPSTPWVEEKDQADWSGPIVRHTFTHFHFEVRVQLVTDLEAVEGVWVYPQDLKNYALPTVMKKIIASGFNKESLHSFVE